MTRFNLYTNNQNSFSKYKSTIQQINNNIKNISNHMHSQTYSSYHYQMQLILYINDHQLLPPNKITEIFTQLTFQYTKIQFSLRKWDYRIDMIFDNKNSRQNAIEEIKKLKSVYGISYHYDLKKNLWLNKYLMDQREYYRVIDESYKARSQPAGKKVDLEVQNAENKIKLVQMQQENSNKKDDDEEIMNIQQQNKLDKPNSPAKQPQKQIDPEQIRKQREQRIKLVLKNNALISKLIQYELKCAKKAQKTQ